MANQEHLSVLRDGVEAWNRWRKEHPGARPDLCDADLSRIHLYQADLSVVCLRGAFLHGVSLRGADLTGADLSRAYMTGADLSVSHGCQAQMCETSLSGSDLRGADLTGANLRGADLISTNLSEAILRQAILRQAKLSEANLRGVNFTEADLRGADLSKADLSKADLTRADLSGADLHYTDLSVATLSGADFKAAVLGRTILASVDLARAQNLDLVRHDGPSSIGLDTFCDSKGQIPEAFLRGAGVPDDFIQYSSTPTRKEPEFYSCFISYSHEDRPFARLLYDALQKRGIRCWVDEKQLLPGDPIFDSIDKGIRNWDKVLLCCSKASLKSWWVDTEIQITLAKEQDLSKERRQKVHSLIPLDLDGYILDGHISTDKWDNGMRTQVLNRFIADFVGWEKDSVKFDERLERLIRALRVDGGAREPTPERRL